MILTAMAAVLAFIPLTHSVFWGTLAYTLIGGTFAGTILTLMFLPAMYAIWFRIRPGQSAAARHGGHEPASPGGRTSARAGHARLITPIHSPYRRKQPCRIPPLSS